MELPTHRIEATQQDSGDWCAVVYAPDLNVPKMITANSKEHALTIAKEIAAKRGLPAYLNNDGVMQEIAGGSGGGQRIRTARKTGGDRIQT